MIIRITARDSPLRVGSGLSRRTATDPNQTYDLSNNVSTTYDKLGKPSLRLDDDELFCSEAAETHELPADKCKGRVSVISFGPSTSHEKTQQPQPFISDTYDKLALFCSSHASASSISPALSVKAQIDMRVFMVKLWL